MQNMCREFEIAKPLELHEISWFTNRVQKNRDEISQSGMYFNFAAEINLPSMFSYKIL